MAFNWLLACKTRQAEISRLRMVATSFSRLGICHVGALVDETPYMNGQLAAVYIICLVAQQIEKLGVDHADEEVEGAVRIAHDEEQCRFLIAQRVQLQLIVHSEVTQLLDVEGG